MSGYGPTGWKGCITFALLAPFMIVAMIFRAIRERISK